MKPVIMTALYRLAVGNEKIATPICVRVCVCVRAYERDDHFSFKNSELTLPGTSFGWSAKRRHTVRNSVKRTKQRKKRKIGITKNNMLLNKKEKHNVVHRIIDQRNTA